MPRDAFCHCFQAALKASNELPRDALAIDYTGMLGRLQPGIFETLATVTVPVSWNKEGQVMHIYKHV